MSQTAFLFPGQGAQTVGMAVELCKAVPAAKALFDRAAAVLGYDLLAVCEAGPKERLDSTVVSQPAIFVASLAALEKLKLDEPDAVTSCAATAGLSLGEYTALTFAGVLSFEDGLRLVRTRGEAMQAAADAKAGAMASVLMLEQDKLDPIVEAASAKGFVRIANFLSAQNLAVSGDTAAVEEVMARAEAAGARMVVRLAVAGAFHTPLMQPAVETLAASLAGMTLAAPRIPVYANVTSQPHGDVESIRGLLARQVVEPVLWDATMKNLVAAGVTRFVEIGPGKVLTGLLKRGFKGLELKNVPA